MKPLQLVTDCCTEEAVNTYEFLVRNTPLNIGTSVYLRLSSLLIMSSLKGQNFNTPFNTRGTFLIGITDFLTTFFESLIGLAAHLL
jgi:hypothetical protein